MMFFVLKTFRHSGQRHFPKFVLELLPRPQNLSDWSETLGMLCLPPEAFFEPFRSLSYSLFVIPAIPGIKLWDPF